jgi:RimJ/RimL family protein N-acetyltransferase
VSLGDLQAMQWPEDVSLDAITQLIRDAAAEPGVLHDTYLPAATDQEDVGQWLDSFVTHLWLITLDGESAGVIFTHAPIRVVAGSDTVEIGSYVVPHHRGRGVASAAWALAEDRLPESVNELIAVVWEDNSASLRRLEKDGFHTRERIRYAHRGGEGWCTVLSRRVRRTRR